MASIMRQQRQEFMDFLGAIAELDDLPMVSEDAGDLQNEYVRALGPEQLGGTGKQGVIAIFQTVIAPPDDKDDFGRVYKFTHRVGVFENVLVNRATGPGSGTGVTYEEWIERICRNTTAAFKSTVAASPLILAAPGIENIAGRFFTGPSETDYSEYPGKMATFSCSGTLGLPTLPTIAVPVIAQDPDTGIVTMTSATPGAAIFYTTDGTRPRAGKTLYTAPFMPVSGVLLQARAVLAGWLQPAPDRAAIASLQT